jgi:5-methylcytosine-specific restriction endonuclease McrA
VNQFDSTAVLDLKRRLDKASSAEERRLIHGRIRSQRLKEARARGTHTEQEWHDLVAKFDLRCVRCGCTPAGRPCKDHIVPIYVGGSDAIDNLQPLCRECNSSKTVDTTNWVKHRTEFGFLDVDIVEERF